MKTTTHSCSELPPKGRLAMAVLSDIHLGNRRNPAAEIVKNLRQEFPDSPETGELDVIFLAGDVFDELLQLTNLDVDEIDFWIADFLRMCKKRKILVRVLKGTPSHDWDQPRRFTTLNEAAKIGADLKYVSTLSIEHIEHLGIHVLYVPDEWELTTEKTLAQVRALLKAKGLEKVDYAIMHGQFDYQLPGHVKAPKHDSAAYLELVADHIFIGHVHTFSTFVRIVAQGSFDRLSHGEEAPKGHVRFYRYDDDNFRLEFRENKGAKRFVTLNCEGMGLEQTLEKIHTAVADLPDGSYVRVESESTNPLFSNMDVLIRAYPFLYFSKLPIVAEADEILVVEEESVFIPPTITKENAHGLVMDRLEQRSIRSDVMSRASELLEQAIAA